MKYLATLHHLKVHLIMALHKAIQEGRLVQFRILLQGVKGINPNARDHDSKTPLMICSAVNHERLSVIFATHLLTWGADVGVADKIGRNALCWACWKGSPPLVEAILDAYPDTCFYDMRQTDNRGNTVLHYAALGGNKLIVKMIIETFIAMAIPLNPFNNKGETPVDIAVKNGHMESARVFVDIGAGQGKLFVDNTDDDSSHNWLPSDICSDIDNESRNTSLLMSDGNRVKSTFSGQKQLYRHKQRVEAEGGTTVVDRKRLPIVSRVYNAFEAQFSYLYRSGAVTPPEPEEVPEEEAEIALSTAAQAVKFAHLLKQGKQEGGTSRTSSTMDSYTDTQTTGSRAPSRYSLSKRKSSMGFNKDHLSDKSGRTSSMRGGGRAMSRARSRVGSSMRARQRPMSRQQSMGGKKTSGDNKRGGNYRSERQRLNSAKAKLRLPMRQTRSMRFIRRGSWPTDPVTIRRLAPKDVDVFKSRGVNSMKRWRSEWDLDNLSMLQMSMDTSVLKAKGIGRGRYKNTPRGRNQKLTPRRGGKAAMEFKKGFKLDLSSTSFVDISDLMPSKSPMLTSRSNANTTNSPTPATGRNKSPTTRSKKGRNKEQVVEQVIAPVRSAGWINRRIKKLQEDIRILDAKQKARARKIQKSILKSSTSFDEVEQLQQSLRAVRINQETSDDEAKRLAEEIINNQAVNLKKKKKRVRIVTTQNSPGSSEKSSSGSDSEFELSDAVKTGDLLRAFLEKHHFATFQDRYLPNIIRRPAIAPLPTTCTRNMTKVSLTSRPRLPNRPATSLYPGQGQIVADASTLSRYHSNPLANVGINPSVGEKFNQKMQVSKPVHGFWRPVRPIWMG